MIEFKLRRGNKPGNVADYSYFTTTLNNKYINMPTALYTKLNKVFTTIAGQM